MSQSQPKLTPATVIKAEEPWTVLALADGTTIKMRLNIHQIVRVEGAYNPDGTPEYRFGWAPTIVVESPAHLMKPRII